VLKVLRFKSFWLSEFVYTELENTTECGKVRGSKLINTANNDAANVATIETATLCPHRIVLA